MSKEQYTRLTTKSDNYKDEVAEEIQQRELRKCRHQYLEVTTVTDINKTFICSKCGKIRKINRFRNYIPESYLDNYEPLDNNDIDYITE